MQPANLPLIVVITCMRSSAKTYLMCVVQFRGHDCFLLALSMHLKSMPSSTTPSWLMAH